LISQKFDNWAGFQCWEGPKTHFMGFALTAWVQGAKAGHTSLCFWRCVFRCLRGFPKNHHCWGNNFAHLLRCWQHGMVAGQKNSIAKKLIRPYDFGRFRRNCFLLVQVWSKYMCFLTSGSILLHFQEFLGFQTSICCTRPYTVLLFVFLFSWYKQNSHFFTLTYKSIFWRRWSLHFSWLAKNLFGVVLGL